ncbi:hypothetical protein [Butyricimonas paravirosa]
MGITEGLHEDDFLHQVRGLRTVDDSLELPKVGAIEGIVTRHILDKENGRF